MVSISAAINKSEIRILKGNFILFKVVAGITRLTFDVKVVTVPDCALEQDTDAEG